MALSPHRLEKTPVSLVVAASARVLAESGRKGDIGLLAIDQYGDEDTRKASQALIRAESREGGLDPEQVIAAMEILDPKREAQVLLGGGLDSHPELIVAIAEQRTLLGNSPDLFKQLKDPQACFPLLDALGIPYPDVCWQCPGETASWLLKTGCSEGGKGVRFSAHDQPGPGDYYQRRLAGSTYSVLFLANGDALKIIGFNTLQTLAAGKTPFLFAGAMNFTDLQTDVRRAVAAFALKLVRKTGLVGLNSLDFMIDPLKGPLVLEINPRPSATMALYDRDAPHGLLRAHMQAAGGDLMPISATTHFRAFHVVLATRHIVASTAQIWPSWAHDRPSVGSSVMAGTPFCTVEAEASSPRRALKLLMRRIGHLKTLMDTAMQTPSFSYPV